MIEEGISVMFGIVGEQRLLLGSSNKLQGMERREKHANFVVCFLFSVF